MVQFEAEEGAALSFFGNERYYSLYPFRLAWKLESVAVLKFLQFLVRCHERANDLASRSQVFPCERAGQYEWLCFLLSIGHDKHLFLFCVSTLLWEEMPLASPRKRVYNFKYT
jgi:hypothetical protein